MSFLTIHPGHLGGDSHLGGEVLPARVRELRLDRWPPEVVTIDGRIGLVHATHRRDLENFGRLHGIPVVSRDDLWSLLAEEFLDTEFDPPQKSETLRRLAENGIDEAETRDIRARIGPRMLAYTALTWEWVHYGLADVLLVLPAGDRPWVEGIANRAIERRRQARLPEASLDDVIQRCRWRFPWGHDTLRDELISAWCEPHRAYHGPRHLLAVLDAIAGHHPAEAFILAAFFHDAVYDPTRADNEVRSVEWLDRATPGMVEKGVKPADLALARLLVLATAHPLDEIAPGPHGKSIRRFLDADFGVFASLADDYATYVQGVRAEYAFVDDDAFAAGRAAFIEKLAATVHRRGFFFSESTPFAEHVARQKVPEVKG